MTQKLTNEKARELLKELQYAKVQMGGQLSIRDEYFKQALEDKLRLEEAFSEPVAYVTYKGYLLHAGDPKVAEYSEPEPLYMRPEAYQ